MNQLHGTVRCQARLICLYGLESTVLGLHDLSWSLRFLELEQNFLNYLVIVL